MLSRIRTSIEQKDEGFTLIELLVVIIIIGILAAIAIPVFLNQRTKATEASMKSDLRTVADEMETYYATYSAYPSGSGSGTLTIGTDNVTLSKGNTVQFMDNSVAGGSKEKFCVSVTNAGTSNTYRYDSAKGGVLPANATCTP